MPFIFRTSVSVCRGKVKILFITKGQLLCWCLVGAKEDVRGKKKKSRTYHMDSYK